MKRSNTSAGQQKSTENGDCRGQEPNPVAEGIVGAALVQEGKTLTIDYDPDIISDESVRRETAHIALLARQQFDRCVLRLNGRACEACALKLESKAQKIRGIRRARATFIGGVMSVTFDHDQISPQQVLEGVRETGAPVTPITAVAETPRNLGEWIQSHSEAIEVAFTALTFVFMIAGWLAPRFGATPVLTNIFFIIAYFTGGFFGVQAGFRSLRQLTINVDLLMILAALGAAFVGSPFEGAMLLFLFSLSNVLQAYAVDRTRRAISSLMKLRPDKALTRRDGNTVLLPIEQLVVGDILIVRPGEGIPLDSIIVEGATSIDESSLTGESIPVAKKPGDTVFAATINQTGGLEVRVTKLAKDSTIERLIRMVEVAQSEKAETQRFLDRAEQLYAIAVISFTALLIVLPLVFLHEPFKATFYRAMTVMVVASPCALIISTPASILSAIGGAARRGVLFKGGVHLERTATIEQVAFDKTGTLTEGKPRVTDIICVDEEVRPDSQTPNPPAKPDQTPNGLTLLQLAASVEAKSEHPLAAAVVTETKRRQLPIPDCVGFQSVSGKGASGMVDGRRIVVGSIPHFETLGSVVDGALRKKLDALQDAGKTCVLVGELSKDAVRIFGGLGIADVLRNEAADMVRKLKAIGVQRVVMVTGDNHRVAAAIAQQAGVDEVHAELLPEDIVRIIRSLKELGPIAMVGDGVNDAPALATATVGIAMGAAGTDVAMETADVVLMSDNLHNIPYAISISRRARTIIWQNLTIATSVIVILIASALGFALPLTLGVMAHEGSTVLVCLNGLRLLGFGANGTAKVKPKGRAASTPLTNASPIPA